MGAALESARLLTLTGAGGVGKTRLAQEVAARRGGDVWSIELATVADPALVASTLAQTLDVRPLPGLDEVAAAIGFLADRRALLVLDNCEHVVAEAARVAEALLRACPRLSVLATSRVPLAIPGETRWAVPPLSVPAGDDLAGSHAAQLFLDRARRVDRSLRADPRAVAEICRRLEGLPLALELAAARVAVLPPEAIARGLEDALGLLEPRARVAEARHPTMRASLDWSHRLLPPHAQVLLRRLGVFAGGATLALAEQVCTGDGLPPERLLESLETLVEHSLVRVEAGRYRLLEVVRQYALERLDEAVERAAVRDRHRDALLALAERQRRAALTPRQPEAFAALDAEDANLAAAFERALESAPEQALRLCLALEFWYRARARFREADAAYARAIEASDPPAVLRARALAARAWLVGSWGQFERANRLAAAAAGCAEQTGDEGVIAVTLLVLANHRFFTDPVAALELLHRCRELAGDDYIAARTEALVRGVAWFRQDEPACRAGADELRGRLERLGDRETLAWFLFEQGAVLYPLGAHAEAAELLAQAVAAAAEIGEPTADRAARTYRALIDVAAGDAAGALTHMRAVHADTMLHGGSFALPWIELLVAQAEAASGELGAARVRLGTLLELEAWGAAHALAWAHAELAEVLRLLDDGAAAAACAGRACELAGALGNTWLLAKAQLTRGRLAARAGAWGEAERLHHEALATIWERGYRLELAGALEALAELADGSGRPEDAARLLGAAGRERREHGFVAWPGQRAEPDALTERVRATLGAAAFERARDEGAALAPADAVAWLRRSRRRRRRAARGWDSLTPAELEVVRQAAAGLTNPEIGERLFMTRATVKTHLSHVYAKLGVRNRSQLAAEAAGRLAREDGRAI